MRMNKENKGVGVTMENAIEYFKSHCKIFCDDFMKKIPEDSVAYQATLKEKEFYDLAIKSLEKAREENPLVYDNEETSVFSCENCKYELLSPEVEPCCDCKNAHKNYFEAKTRKGLEEPSVNDTLGKIRAEIVSLTYYWDEVNPKNVKEDVLEIIDKYKGESEVSG
jgi:hypothetical protein